MGERSIGLDEGGRNVGGRLRFDEGGGDVGGLVGFEDGAVSVGDAVDEGLDGAESTGVEFTNEDGVESMGVVSMT